MFEVMVMAFAESSNLTMETFERGHAMLEEQVTPTGLHRIQALLWCLVVLAIYDVAVASRYAGRWFNIHAFANAITVIGSIPAMVLWIQQPMKVVNARGWQPPDPMGENWYHPEVMFHPSNDWAILMIIAVHTYHCLAFKLSQQDIFHHFMFVPTLGVGGGLFTPWGPIRNCLCFFISGLPGGIDYIMLVLLKNNMTDQLTCKRLSSKLNVWLRGPGCGVLLPATLYCAFTEGHIDPDMVWRSALLGAFAAYNGLYYMEMSIKNYQMHLTRTLAQEEHSAEIEKLHAYWASKETATRKVSSGFDLQATILGGVSTVDSEKEE